MLRIAPDEAALPDARTSVDGANVADIMTWLRSNTTIDAPPGGDAPLDRRAVQLIRSGIVALA
jgi:hypothetical protein